MKKSTAIVVLGTLGGSAFLAGCRSNTGSQESRYDNSVNGGRGGYVGGGGYRGGSGSVSSPRGGFGSIGRSIGGFFSGG